MPGASSRILLVLAATWITALCVVHLTLSLLTAGAFALVEAARRKDWIEPGTAMTVVLIGWALYSLILSRTTSPAATTLFAGKGYLNHARCALLGPKRKEGRT